MNMVKNKTQSRLHNTSQSQSGTNINSGAFSNSNTFRTYPPDVYRNTYYNNGSRYKYERFPRKFPRQNPTRKSNYHVNDRGGPFARIKKKPTTSPALGSEEHTLLKIKQTSAIIMRQILNPEDNIIAKSIKDNSLESEQEPISNLEKTGKRTMKVSKSKSKEQGKGTPYSVEEIHNKIMHHLTNLNNGKKRNLINSNSTGYDELIQKIIKQKRLEISRALRNISSNNNDTQSTDFINSMIPDMIGIKIEDLPQEFIEELRCTFDISVQGDFSLMNNDCSEVGINYAPNTMPFSSTGGDSSYKNASSCEVFFNGGPNVVIDLTDADDLPVDINIQAVQSDILNNDITKWNVKTPENHNSHLSGEITPKKELSDDGNMNSNGDFAPEIFIPKPFSTVFSTTDVNLSSDQCISNQFIEERNKDNFSENNTSQTFSNDDVMVDNLNTEHEIKSENIIYPFDHDEIDDVENSRANLDIETQNTRLKKNMLDSEEPSSSTGVEIFDEMTKTSKVDDNVVEIRREDIYNESNEIHVKKECQEICEDKNDTEEVNVSNEKVKENEICKVCEYSEISTQTEENPIMSMKSFLKQAFPKPPRNVKAAVKRMTSIDKYISDLILYRKNVLNPYLSSEYNIKVSQKVSKNKNRKQKNCSTLKGEEVNKKRKKNNGKVIIHDERIVKKKKSNSEEEQSCTSEVGKEKNGATANDSNPSIVENDDTFEGISRTDVSATELKGPSVPVQDLLAFQEINESFLDLKVTEDRLLASTSNGRIHFFSLQNGRCMSTLEVSEKAVSSLLCLRAPDEKLQIFVGTLDGFLRVYNFYSQCLLKLIKLEENVQCMAYNWNYIFIGGSGGSILRYSVKKRAIEYEDKYYNDTIFVLKAILEGARRVLLIGSRNSPVVIRDAMNGLHLRTMQDLVCPTVYSLVIKNNMVYCGTTNLDILVFNFHSGQLEHKLKATNAKGISCLKIFGRLLFASCHSGDVFVYNIENNTFLGIIEGPGGVILSMEIIVNQVVVGTMSSKFVSMLIPQHILREK